MSNRRKQGAQPVKPPLKEGVVFFAVFIVVGLIACAFPLFLRLLGVGSLALAMLARPLLIAGVLLWGARRVVRWLRSGGENAQ